MKSENFTKGIINYRKMTISCSFIYNFFLKFHGKKNGSHKMQGFSSAPSQFKNEQKLPKMVYIIPNSFVLHFGENFMKIRTKIAKLQMHEKLHNM